MKYSFIGILLIAIVFPISLFGQKATAVLLSNKMKIGEYNVLDLTLNFSSKENKAIAWPAVGDILTNAKLDIIEIGSIDSILNDKKEFLGLRQKITFSAFDSNSYYIPSIPFYSLNNADTNFIAITDSLLLSVTTVEVDTTKAFKDIKGPMDEPIRFFEILPYIITGFAIIVALILAWYLYRKFKKKEPLFKILQKPAIKPSNWALDQLNKLKNKKLWQQGFVKDYYVELTEIIRRYFQEEFKFNALEMTSSEIIDELKSKQFNTSIIDSVNFIINNADLAKFAKSKPLDVENEKCSELSVEIIKRSQEYSDQIKAKIVLKNNEELNKKGGEK